MMASLYAEQTPLRQFDSFRLRAQTRRKRGMLLPEDLYVDPAFPPDMTSLSYVYSGDDKYERMVFTRPKVSLNYRQFSNTRRTKSQKMFLVSSCTCLYNCQSNEARCWVENEYVVGAAPTVINIFIARGGASYTRDLTVIDHSKETAFISKKFSWLELKFSSEWKSTENILTEVRCTLHCMFVCLFFIEVLLSLLLATKMFTLQPTNGKITNHFYWDRNIPGGLVTCRGLARCSSAAHDIAYVWW